MFEGRKAGGWLLKDGRLAVAAKRRLTGLQEGGWRLYGNKLRTDKNGVNIDNL